MPSTTQPRPSAPNIERNAYRGQSGSVATLPSFLEARPRLPEPILPEHTEWVEMYWRAWEIAWSQLRRPKSGSGLIAAYVAAAAATDHLFLQDTAFISQFGIYGRRAFDFITSLDNFYAKQHVDGFICREIDPESGSDRYLPFDPDGTGPNVLAWAEWRYYRASGDDDRLAQVFWPLLAYHHWMRAHRTWPSGLYWATGLSSGMSNQPRVPDSRNYHRHWSWVDASMQAAISGKVLAQMATRLKEEAFVELLEEEQSTLVELINRTMWNPDQHFYQDIGPDGRFSSVKSIGAFWGLSDNSLVPEDRLNDFVQHLRDSWSFNLPHRIPSQAADSEGYNAQSGHFWRGAVWPMTNYMVLKGLRGAGKRKLAHAIAMNHMRNVCAVYLHTDTFWENYAPESETVGETTPANHVGAAGLTPIAMLLEDVIGVHVDWPLRRVSWDRRLKTNREYGVRNFPVGPEGIMDLIGNEEKIYVTTDTPFSLHIRDSGQLLQAAVPVGTTEIDLT